MLNMPCSRVGHVYRRNVPYTYDKPNAVLINFKRVAEVWMGDFKEFLYQRRPEIRHQKHGNVVDRLAIRDSNKCKDFKWYLMNVANDTIRTKYQPHRGEGQITHIDSGLCLDVQYRSAGQTISLQRCSGAFSQKFMWTNIFELRQEPEECLDARYADTNNVYIEKCHELGGNQKFTYDEASSQLKHGGTGMCVSAPNEPHPQHPNIETCNGESHLQKWKLKVNDPNQQPPAWARIADDLPLPPVP
jgi:polypeptide N-acetylgalactosaminyltransferase